MRCDPPNSEGRTLETDVCIIGAGPAGLTLASELANRTSANPPDVVVLESGDYAADATLHALNDGDVIGDAYAGLQRTRNRQVGGTTGLWNTPADLRHKSVGAKYARLDPVDFESRPEIDLSGWPFAYQELEPFYARAEAICGLASLGSHQDGDSKPDRSALHAPSPFHGTSRFSRLIPGHYQVGPRGAFIDPLVSALHASPAVRLYARSTVTRLEAAASRSGARTVLRAAVTAPGKPTWYVRARKYVLCAGAVENARLLLVSAASSAVPWEQSPWLGRCFMEHPRYAGISLVSCSRDCYRQLAFYDLHHQGPALVVGRLGLDPDLVRRGELPNASVTLLPRLRWWARKARAFTGSLGGIWPGPGHGWSRTRAPRLAFDGFALLLNVEQRPHAENRVDLGQRRDVLGIPVPELHWRWRDTDQALLDRLRRLVTEEFTAVGLGRIAELSREPIDPNARHHAGTTRMHEEPHFGVVDPDGRVHGTDNVFVTGASVFPTAGFANPVLTIVALSIRLADHLARL